MTGLPPPLFTKLGALITNSQTVLPDRFEEHRAIPVLDPADVSVLERHGRLVQAGDVHATDVGDGVALDVTREASEKAAVAGHVDNCAGQRLPPLADDVDEPFARVDHREYGPARFTE